MKKLLVTFGLFLGILGSSYAQIGKELEDDFQKFKEEQERDFQEFKDARDKEFASFLKQRWIEMHPEQAPKNLPEKPKPTVQPVVDRDRVVGLNPKKIGIRLPKVTTPVPGKINLPKPKVIVEDANGNNRQLDFDFYDTELTIHYDLNLVQDLDGIDEKSVASYWERMSTSNYFSFLEATLDIKRSLQLNDWAYYLLLKEIASEIYPETEESEQNLFIWFVLSKAGYQSKVARIDSKIGLMIPFKNKVFDKSYISLNNQKYYIVSPVKKGDRIYTYAKNYPETPLVMDLNIYKPLYISSTIETKEFSFSYAGVSYEFDIAFHSANVAFYQDIFPSDIEVYYEAQMRNETKESLRAGLRPIIQGKSKKEALNIILRFVQTAFDYKTDGDQFGREKYFFAEELFHFDYSDCEDRSILFAYLTRDLLELEVIGLIFPGHAATAVLLDESIKGDYITFKNKNYLICDPTYINADIGMAMPKFKNVTADVVPLFK